jgi:hypothetical protein
LSRLVDYRTKNVHSRPPQRCSKRVSR